ncbi:MAG: ribonucleotide reductase N-terminal alpha domain-containing protein, partial [Sulfolobaceae archaeon]
MESTILSVIKRDGSREEFKPEKILSKLPIPDDVIVNIFNDIARSAKNGMIDTKTIADIIERNLVENGVKDIRFFELAKEFVLARIYNHVYGKSRTSAPLKDFSPKDLLLSYNALKVLESRYLLKDPDTQRFVETPQMMFRRVARYLAEVERKYGKSEEEIRKIEEEFYTIMSDLKFLPNTPTLMNSGTRLGILSACFVIPVRDSMVTQNGEGIYDALRAMAVVHQQGGGTGFDFSELRPKGDVV